MEWEDIDMSFISGYDRVIYYLQLTDDEFRAKTSRARSRKIIFIRKCSNELSSKARYDLAVWLMQRDERYIK